MLIQLRGFKMLKLAKATLNPTLTTATNSYLPKVQLRLTLIQLRGFKMQKLAKTTQNPTLTTATNSYRGFRSG